MASIEVLREAVIRRAGEFVIERTRRRNFAWDSFEKLQGALQELDTAQEVNNNMPRRVVGERVGAIQSATAERARLFGYGIYAGDEVPPEDVMGPFGRPGLFGIPNPKIVLDNGTVVWGCESWWCSESGMQKILAGREIQIVKPVRSEPTEGERTRAVEVIEKARKYADDVVADIQARIQTGEGQGES